MRISDWSSDVCSSDLVSRLQRQILAGRDNSAFGESGACDRHILRQNLRRFSKDRQRQMMLAQDEAIGLQIVHRFDQMLLLAKRSEEHTSELQSLMRISYAVFCLKKQTYNNNHQISHN